MQQQRWLMVSAAVALACPLTALAGVKIDIVPDRPVLTLGESMNVSIFATFSQPVIGWGLDFDIADEDVVLRLNPPMIESPWLPLTSPDGDDFVATSLPSLVGGKMVLLATVPVLGVELGVTTLSVSATDGDLTEGFALDAVGAFDTFSVNEAIIEVVPVTCLGDLVSSATFTPPPDGTVNAADLAFLLGEWGVNPGSPADLVSSATFTPPPDGVVDAADLAVLLGAWGPCG